MLSNSNELDNLKSWDIAFTLNSTPKLDKLYKLYKKLA